MSEDKPAMVFKTKPDSSIVQSIKLVKENKADAVISAGNTAAVINFTIHFRENRSDKRLH